MPEPVEKSKIIAVRIPGEHKAAYERVLEDLKLVVGVNFNRIWHSALLDKYCARKLPKRIFAPLSEETRVRLLIDAKTYTAIEQLNQHQIAVLAYNAVLLFFEDAKFRAGVEKEISKRIRAND